MSKGFKAPEPGKMSNKPKGYASSGVGPDGAARFNKAVSSIKAPSKDVISMAGTVSKGFKKG